jgi:SNF2 family DNA or RNA helicase
VQSEERIRNELMKAYESLSPDEQVLVQLCSVIYEPVSTSTLFKILRRAGLRIAGERIRTGRDLEPRLGKVRSLGLLDESCRVPREIIEVITKRAVAAGRIFDGRELLKGIESDDAWTSRPKPPCHCLSCASPITRDAFMSSVGPLCHLCAESELRVLSDGESLETWPVARIQDALSPEGDNIRARLSVLWNFVDAYQPLSYGSDGGAKELLRLLVPNLGYSRPHPLSPAVRQAALRACCLTRHQILPVLLEMVQKEPAELYLNMLKAMGYIAVEDRAVQAVMKDASQDSRPEIRGSLVALLKQYAPSWAKGTIEKLSKDKDSTVRDLARKALDAMKQAHGRGRLFRGGSYRIQDTAIRPSIRFGPFARAVQEELPLSAGYSYGQKVAACPRIMRDLRIGIYSKDSAYIYERLGQLSSTCGKDPAYSDAVAQVCNSPFDADWFAGLPVHIQLYGLCGIFQESMSSLKPDAEALAYTMRTSAFKSEPESERTSLLYYLASRLIMGGRLGEAEGIVEEIKDDDYSAGLMGWLLFVKGNNEEAIKSIESDVKELRRRSGKRNINFGGLVGLFYVLALLRSQNGDFLKKAEQLISWSLSAIPVEDERAPAFRSLNGIVQAQKLEVEKGRQVIANESKDARVIPSLFNAMAGFWVDGRLSAQMMERMGLIFRLARKAEINWMAMESAALLIRAGEETSERRELLDRTTKQGGMQSLVSSLLVEEPWQKGLRALMQIGGESEQPAGDKLAATTRLIWLVGYSRGTVSLQPIEQKRRAGGQWTKGRPVAMSRLYSRTKLEYISQQDHAMCSALKREQSYYYGDTYYFDMNKLLPAMVGHPLLFLDGSPTVPVEVVKGEPEIRVAKSGSKLKIKFAVELGEDRAMVIQETPTRFKVIELAEKHRRMAQVLGNAGLVVPASAREEVLNAVAVLSSHVLVHSDIGGKSKDAVEVASDPTPYVQLIPTGKGFRVEIFVKPFKEEASPYLKPASGAANVMAEVGGRRVQTRRDLKTEEQMADAVEAASATLSRLADSDRQWLLEDPEDCLQVLLDLKALQDQSRAVVEWPEGEKLRITREIPFDQLRMRIRGKTDWFEVSGGLRVDDNLVVDMKRLLDLINTTSSRFVPLEDGLFLTLTAELRKRLEELNTYAEKKGKEVRLHPLAALAMQDLLEAVPNLDVDKAWKSRIERIRAGREISPPIPSTLKAELRDYQMEGYTWLARLAHMGIGACLADDMGLGKTVQALGTLLHRAALGPSLVVAPTSVCWNWVTEANRFAPTLNVAQFGGNNREGLVRGLGPSDVFVTSYGLLIQETELLSSIDWNVVVLDEAQAIKNFLTKRSRAAMGLKGSFKIITTGTPIENHLAELWTLFNFINPGLLGSLQRFNERFAVPIEKYNNRDARKRLKRLIQPFILRRVKSQVLDELPPRTEVVLHVEMGPEETAFYEALRQQALARIEVDDAPIAQKHLQILAEITKLRQAACNPRLVMPGSDLSSSKLELFAQVVSELLENRHKALVFSQFVGHLRLIREYLDALKIGYRYLDGSTPPGERKKEVDAFQSGEGDLFLISLKAGGLGLNLTAADYVIHMDPWWNPAVEDQASDRAYRIGQQHPVTIYRMVTKGTIEEKIVKLHQEKRDLAGSLLDGSDISGKISAEELVRLIREK